MDRLFVPEAIIFLDAAVGDGGLNSTRADPMQFLDKDTWGDRPAALNWSNFSNAFLTREGS